MSNEVDLRKQRKVEASVSITGGATSDYQLPAPNKTVTNIPASLSEFVIYTTNSLRREVTLHNNTNGIVYVLYGIGVTTTNYSHKLNRQDTLHVDDYRGQINAICSNATGFLMATETYY